MKRKIIKIDADICNGCGQCIPDCPEGALQMIDGKARLISDLFCDGLGACMGACPVGAISVEEREAAPYSEEKVLENIIKAGPNTIKAHLKHLDDHGETGFLNEAIELLKKKNIEVPKYKEKESSCADGSCQGSKIIDMTENKGSSAVLSQSSQNSQLKQWPVQLSLVNPQASYFNDADLLVAADCVPFASANFHNDYLKNKVLVIFCPKLDSDIESYINKLSVIIGQNSIKSITVVRMQVPCCGGTTMILREALKKAGKEIEINEHILSLQGEEI